MTKTKLFECKNYNWNRYINDSKLLAKLKSDLGQKNDIASLNEKAFVFQSKNIIPPELDELRKWLEKKSIELIEG